MSSAHDRHLAQFSYAREEMLCEACDASSWVEVFSEYGQSWIEPEECPACNHTWGEPLEDEPDDH